MRYTSLPQEDFFGFGAESSLDSHTSYERQGIDTRAWALLQTAAGRRDPLERRSPGCEDLQRRAAGRPLDGPGPLDPDFDSTTPERALPPRRRRGNLDRRDDVRNPSRGTFLRASLDRFACFTLGDRGVTRFDVDVRTYVPVGGILGPRLARRARRGLPDDQRRAIARRAFFLLPRLGGGGTLRGYETSRFVDAQAAFMSAEYRWQVRRKLQVVGFVDAGTVAASVSQFSGSRLHSAVGAGVRYRGFRVDYAVGREGSRVHVGFGPSF